MMSLNCLTVHLHCQLFKFIPIILKKRYETVKTNPAIHIYINRLNNRLVSKIKDEWKLELQTPETMKLFGTTKKINRQDKEWRKCTNS